MPSSSGFSRSLVLDRPGGWRVPAFVGVVTLLAWVAIGLGRLPWRASLVLSIAVAAIAAWEIAGIRPGGRRSLAAIEVCRSGGLLLACAAGQPPSLPATLHRFWVLVAGPGPALVIGLQLISADGRYFPVILFRDQVDAATWRRLVVWMSLTSRSQPERAEASRGQPKLFTVE